MNTVIAGCGYVGQKVLRLGGFAPTDVQALVYSESSEQLLQALGYPVARIDLDQPLASLPAETATATILYTIAPPSSGDADPRLGHFLAALEPALPARIVLISTTGIYGDCHGDWITEQQGLNPQVDRARRRVDAERRLQAWCADHGVDYVILRVPGIYGPDKLPEKRLRSGKPVLCPEQSPWSNRIHVDDLAQACLAAMRTGAVNQVFNISDNAPSTMTDYFNHVADYLGIERPPCISFEQAQKELGEGMMSYLSESKRIDNTKMREVLGVELKYPDLDSGLKR